MSSNTKCNSKQIVEKENECLEWLPDGWNVDFRTRKSGAHMGYGYKCYTDPHGKKFYSKVEVLRYLNTIKGTNCTSKEEEECNTMHSSKKEVECNSMPSSKKEREGSSMHSQNNDVVEKSAVEDLPPGWIKEVKVRKGSNGKRKDLFYIDPASGYVFRSKNDALRYLESGDISSCAIKPNKRQIQDEDKLAPTSAGKKQKLNQSATTRQLCVGKETSDGYSLELPDANGSGKRHDVKLFSGMMVAPVPTAEPIGQIQLLENEVACPPKMKKTSNPDDVQEKNHVNLMEKAGKKNRNSPAVSKNKEFNVAHRSSPRLARVEADHLTDNLTNKQNLQVPKRNLRKGKTVLDTDLVSKSSQQLSGALETGKIEDNKPDSPHDSQGLASEAHLLKENKLLVSETGKSREISSNSIKPSNKKEQRIPCRVSKRLAGSEPELVSSSLSHESAPEYKSKKSKGEVNAALHPCASESAVELVGHASMNGGSSNKSRKPSKTNVQLEEHEDEEINDEKSELQQSFAFHYSWSDPSLEFAIKTLTGALPAEDSVGDRPTMISETDKFPENKLFENAKGSSSSNKNPTMISETGKFPENKSSQNVKGSSSGKNPGVNSNKSKNKKELKVPTRLSKRLAGSEPEVQPVERALEYSTRKSFNDKPKAHAILTNGVPGPLLTREEESKLITPESDKLKTSGCSESSNGEKSCDEQTVPSEQLKRVAAENTNDERLDPQFSQFGNTWSDPCVEFAIKTLTGSLSVGAADVVKSPVKEPDVNDPSRKELLETLVHKNNEAAQNYSNHCQTKEELNTAFQPLQLVGQPELRASPTSCENDPKFATRESCSGEGNITRKLDGEQSLNTEAGNVTQIDINSLFLDEPLSDNISRKLDGGQSLHTETGNVTQIDMNSLFLDEPLRDDTTRKLDGGQSVHTEARHATQIDINSLFFDEPLRDNTNRKSDGGQSLYTEAGNVTQIDINSLFLDEPLRENEQVLEGESIAIQPQAETETTNQDNSDRDCVSFMDAWSDPCLEFAFKTLTGALPEQENMAIQGLQEPADPHYQRDGGSMLPEVGSSSISQSDKSMSGQQASMSSSCLPSENPDPHGCTGVDTQKHYSQGNNDKFQW